MSIVRGPQRRSRARLRPSICWRSCDSRQKAMRRQRCRDGDDGVDEGRLIGHAPGRRPVIRGTGHEPHGTIPAQSGDGPIEGRAHVADIAAQRDKGFGHECYARQSYARRLRVMITPTSSKVAAMGACGLRTAAARGRRVQSFGDDQRKPERRTNCD